MKWFQPVRAGAPILFGLALLVSVGYPPMGLTEASVSPKVTTATLPGDSYLTGLTIVGGKLYAYGKRYPPGDETSANPPTCDQAQVNLKTLRLSSLHDVSCTFLVPGINVVPIEQPLGGAKSYAASGVNAQLRVERQDPQTGKVVLGPVLVSFPAFGGSWPVWTYGAGSLWIYGCNTSVGGRLVQVSETTGAVQSSVSAPKVCQPVIAAGSSGFWLGSTTESRQATATLYHFTLGASTPTRISLVGNDVEWIVTSGSETWVDSGQSSPTYEGREGAIIRLDGNDPKTTVHSSDVGLQVGWGIQAAFGNDALGLWTVTPGNAGGPQNAVKAEHVVWIDPESGRWSDVAQVNLALAVNEDQAALSTSGGVVFDGSFYFLEPAELPLTGAAGIVRVTP